MGQEKLGLLLYQARGECYRPDHLQLLFLDGRLPFKVCHLISAGIAEEKGDRFT